MRVTYATFREGDAPHHDLHRGAGDVERRLSPAMTATDVKSLLGNCADVLVRAGTPCIKKGLRLKCHLARTRESLFCLA